MFDLESLKKDNDLPRLCVHVVNLEHSGLSGYVDVHSVDMLIEKLAVAKYERLKYLPIRKLTIFRTCDIGLGYMDYMSIHQLREFMALGKIDKNVPIHLEYKHGNIFCTIYTEDIDPLVLLTDETYLMVDETTNLIHSIKIGKPCNPNLLYFEKQLDKVVTTIDKLVTLPHINSVWVQVKKNDSLF